MRGGAGERKGMGEAEATGGERAGVSSHLPSGPEDCVRRLQIRKTGDTGGRGLAPARPGPAPEPQRHAPFCSPVPRLLRGLRGGPLWDGEGRGRQGCGDGGGGGLLKGRRCAGQEVRPACRDKAVGTFGSQAPGAALQLPLSPMLCSSPTRASSSFSRLSEPQTASQRSCRAHPPGIIPAGPPPTSFLPPTLLQPHGAPHCPSYRPGPLQLQGLGTGNSCLPWAIPHPPCLESWTLDATRDLPGHQAQPHPATGDLKRDRHLPGGAFYDELSPRPSHSCSPLPTPQMAADLGLEEGVPVTQVPPSGLGPASGGRSWRYMAAAPLSPQGPQPPCPPSPATVRPILQPVTFVLQCRVAARPPQVVLRVLPLAGDLAGREGGRGPQGLDGQQGTAALLGR